MKSSNVAFMAAVFGAAASSMAAFTAGDLAILSVNSTGGATINSYTHSGSTFTNLSQHAIPGISLGTVTKQHDGILRQSADGNYLTFAGTSSGQTAVAAVNSAWSPTVTTFTGYTALARSAASTDGTEFWVGGDQGSGTGDGGIRYVNTSGANNVVNVGDARSTFIANGQVYLTTSQGNGGLFRIGNNLPHDSADQTQVIAGTADGLCPKSDALFLDINGDGHIDTAYTTGGKGDFEKYTTTDDGANWSNYTVYSSSTLNNNVGMGAEIGTDGSVQLVIAVVDKVYSLTDTNGVAAGFSFTQSASPTLLFNGPSGESLRGLVILSAVPEPSSMLAVSSLALVGLTKRRRR